MCGAVDAQKLGISVLNCQPLTNIQHFAPNSLPPGCIKDQTTKMKLLRISPNIAIAHLTKHSDAHFCPTKQQTSNPTALV
jgi:hypothetical protein